MKPRSNCLPFVLIVAIFAFALTYQARGHDQTRVNLPISTFNQNSGARWQQICDVGGGNFVLVWDALNGNIFAQMIDAAGEEQWRPGGISICRFNSEQSSPQLVRDGVGGAIVAWHDNRMSQNDKNIYAQRLDAFGELLWNPDGVAICEYASQQVVPRLAMDGAGGAIIAWEDSRSGTKIFAQRVNGNGVVQWAEGGEYVCVSGGGRQSSHQICADGAGGAYVVWEDERDAANLNLYLQQLNASGIARWHGGRVLCNAIEEQNNAALMADGAGGVIATWLDGRHAALQKMAIYGQKMNASGAFQWTTNGAMFCDTVKGQNIPRSVSDGAGGALVAWEDERGSDRDIYAQRLDASGALQWSAGGVALCTAPDDQQWPAIATDGAHGAIAVWADRRGADYDVYAQRVNAAGVIEWAAAGVALCTAEGQQEDQTIAVAAGSDGAVACWIDRRGSNTAVFGQRVDSAGTAQWEPDGRCYTYSPPAEAPQCLADGRGNFILAWFEGKGATGADISTSRKSQRTTSRSGRPAAWRFAD